MIRSQAHQQELGIEISVRLEIVEKFGHPWRILRGALRPTRSSSARRPLPGTGPAGGTALRG
jgi:hypothetical protein